MLLVIGQESLLFLFYVCLVQYLINILGEDINSPVPIGRGAVRGRRQVDIEHFRSPRPQSSLGPSGKEGRLKYN